MFKKWFSFGKNNEEETVEDIVEEQVEETP